MAPRYVQFPSIFWQARPAYRSNQVRKAFLHLPSLLLFERKVNRSKADGHDRKSYANTNPPSSSGMLALKYVLGMKAQGSTLGGE
jgi:hypothetical protein